MGEKRKRLSSYLQGEIGKELIYSLRNMKAYWYEPWKF